MSDNPKVRISDPTCNHAPRGWVSWPPIEEIRAGITHASAICCDREACIKDAAYWVEALTGHYGVFQPYPPKGVTK